MHKEDAFDMLWTVNQCIKKMMDKICCDRRVFTLTGGVDKLGVGGAVSEVLNGVHSSFAARGKTLGRPGQASQSQSSGIGEGCL